MAQSLSARTARQTHETANKQRYPVMYAVDDPSLSDGATVVVLHDVRRESVYVPCDETLLAMGYPVAEPYGDNIPAVADPHPRDDVPAAAVLNIEVGRLRRLLDEMEPLRSRIMRMYWGVFDTPECTQEEISDLTGLSVWVVGQICRAGLEELRERWGVAECPLL